MFRFVWVTLVIFPTFAVAQIHPHFGVEVGTPLTDTGTSSTSFLATGANTSLSRSNSETKRLLIGPAFRLDLPAGLGIEFDALYQRADSDRLMVSSPPLNQSFQALASNRWQFPFLLQYLRKFAKFNWYGEGGPSIEHFTNWQGTSSSFTAALGTSAATSSTSTISGAGNTFAGITFGGGVDIPIRRVHVRPEFRYTHWFSSTNIAVANVLALYPISVSGLASSSFFAAPSGVNPKQNEASFLLGITF